MDELLNKTITASADMEPVVVTVLVGKILITGAVANCEQFFGETNKARRKAQGLLPIKGVEEKYDEDLISLGRSEPKDSAYLHLIGVQLFLDSTPIALPSIRLDVNQITGWTLGATIFYPSPLPYAPPTLPGSSA